LDPEDFSKYTQLLDKRSSVIRVGGAAVLKGLRITRRRSAIVGLVAVGVLVLAGAIVVVRGGASTGSASSTGSTNNGQATLTGGTGAALPYVELQAEHASTNGTVIGPTAEYNQLADEASMRKAVTLTGPGQYVEFTVPSVANSIVVRYSIPDGKDGAVYTAPLSLSIDGAKQPDLTLTNAYSWYYGVYPFVNAPTTSNPHHAFDEVHALLPSMAAGAKVKLQLDSTATASVTVDLVDFENVPAALAQPSGSKSIVDYGADAKGVTDSTSAVNQAVAAVGPGGTVWIPTGTFKVTSHVLVDNVTVTGAGMWYSNLQGAGVGIYGNAVPKPSANVHLSNFAITGDVRVRDDSSPANGIGGAMANSTVSNIWIEHTKVGVWMDGPFDKMTLTGMRIRDTTADGINFHTGITHSSVTNSDIRNTGDDGLAAWSEAAADANDTFDHNTVQLPILANGIAIYGGHDNTVSNNLVVDAGLSEGGGIHVGQRFTSTSLGKTDILNNTLIRDGSFDRVFGFGIGALWFDARDDSMDGAITVDNILIAQSPYEAIQFMSGDFKKTSITNVKISNARIDNTGTFVLQAQVEGSATLTNVVATNTHASAAVNLCNHTFAITDGGSNSGTTGAATCDSWPTPTFPPYGLTANPSALTFGSQASGTTSATQTVTITNDDSSSATISGIAASGDFAQTNNCTTLAANASCTVTVTFKPTATGTRTGVLSVNSNASSSPSVGLIGSAIAPGPVLTADPPNVTFGTSLAGKTTTAKVVTITNNGTTSAKVSAVTISGDFTQTNNCGTIDVGASCAVSVAYSPKAAGAGTGSLTVTSDAVSGPITVALSGVGADTMSSTLSASLKAMGFATTKVGVTSEAQSVTISNTGTADATVSSIATTGDFAQTNTCGTSITAGGTCTINITFTPAASGVSSGNLTVTTDASGGPTTVPLSGAGVATDNIAPGKALSASDYTQTYRPRNAADDNPATYWESADSKFPQWLEIDLGAKTKVGLVVLQLPSSWEARTQTLSVSGSTDDNTWTTLKESADYTFDPATNSNIVTIAFPAADVQYLRLDFTANTGWPAGQVSEWQVYGS
jgi:hypothetical protein